MSAEWFAGRLRELRCEAGLTQEQLAEKVGVKRGAIARWESGTREPSWSNVVALARALGVECTAFLQEPATAAPARPGRPRKPTAEDAEQQEPKRRRGRPRKAPPVAQDKPAASSAMSAPSRQEKPAVGQGRKRKGKGVA